MRTLQPTLFDGPDISGSVLTRATGDPEVIVLDEC